MNHFSIARMGTSDAAKRVDRTALAFQRQQQAQRQGGRRTPVEIETDAAVQAEGQAGSTRRWVERQVALWARRQPHIVVAVKPRWRTITQEVAALYGKSVDDLVGESRTADLIEPRFEAMYRILDETPLSLPEIGRRFNRDHSTVWHAVRTHAERNGLPVPRQEEDHTP